jgi:hypothetical protein
MFILEIIFIFVDVNVDSSVYQQRVTESILESSLIK